MNSIFDTALRLDAPGPRGVAVVNNVRFLGNTMRYTLDRLTGYDQPVVPGRSP